MAWTSTGTDNWTNLGTSTATWDSKKSISFSATIPTSAKQWFESMGIAPPDKPAAGTIDVAGITVTAAQVKQALSILHNGASPYIKNPLMDAGNPLAEVNYVAIAKQEMAADPALRKGKTKTKAALIAHLEKKLSTLEPPNFTNGGLVGIDTSLLDANGNVEKNAEAQAALLDSLTAPLEPPPATWQALAKTGIAPHEWPKEARKAYLAAHADVKINKWSANSCCWNPAHAGGCGADSFVAQAISKHMQKVAAQKKAAEDAILTFSLAPEQPDLPGYHRKMVLVDQHGNRWLFKPAPDGKTFRSETSHAAHVLARAWGFRTAESMLIEFDGSYGQAQRMFAEAGNLAGTCGAEFNTLTVTQLAAIACEHLFDWAIDNDDSKGDNLLRLDDGSIVGVDKDRAWVYFGGWDGLSSHDSANSNAPLVYTELYRAIKMGHVDRAKVDAVYRAVITKARRMQRLPDTNLADIIRVAVANRPHFKPPSYRMPCAGAPTNADELIAAAVERKNRLADDIDTLWTRVYAGAGWEVPSVDGGLGLNAQDHPLYSGLHDAALPAAVAESKSYGTPTFVAGRDIEDAHILLWREHAGARTRIRGQWKTRGTALTRLVSWCKKRTVNQPTKPQPVKQESLPGEARAYETIILNAKSVSFHAEDGAYNQPKWSALLDMKHELKTNRSQALGSAKEWAPAYVDMATKYLDYIESIQIHRANRTKSKDGDYPRYTYIPVPTETPKKPEPAKPAATVEYRPASRAANIAPNFAQLAPDGELVLGSGTLNDYCDNLGQPGYMYLVTLPTGEEIEVRGSDTTKTPTSTRGLTQFTIPDESTITESLRRIDDQLTLMGLAIEPADRDDLELFYWRHLAGIMANRADSRPGGLSLHKAPQLPAYTTFWASAPADKKLAKVDEIAAWRAAFAHLPAGESIPAFLEAGGHLPRFMHMDLRNRELPCGKPYWERFDVTDAQALAKNMPVLHYRSGPKWVMATGVCMATEARIRTFAIWKPGQSSTDDMGHGSAGFVFTRQNVKDWDTCPTVFFSPRVLRRTHNYAFDRDLFGEIAERTDRAHYDFDIATSWTYVANELLIKDALSLLDDIEIVVFEYPGHRDAALAQLASFGITDIRGLPTTTRFITRTNVAVDQAVAAVRESYTHGCQSG